MSEMLFCYCCRTHHPKEQMRPFPTKPGLRWRCLRSIEAAGQPAGQRDEFGRRQTHINREIARRQGESVAQLRRLSPRS